MEEAPAEKSPIKHKCALCPYSTRIRGNYKEHLKTHSNERPFKCPECPFRSKWKYCAQQHLIALHSDKSSRPFPCQHPGCNYAATDKSGLNKHFKIHLDKKPFSCSHPNCNYATSRKGDFVIHTRVHTGENPFVCQFESCSFATAQQGTLVRHSRTHTKEKPYKCPQPNCDYSTAHHGHVRQHQLTHHPKEGEERQSLKCPICEYSGKSKENLTKHIKRHSSEKLFACSFESCEYRCKSKYSLSIHAQTHKDERPYKCQLCLFRGKTRDVVRKHLKNVHSDIRPFKCTEPNCGHASKTKGDLNRHLLTHATEKKHACSFPNCDYRGIGKFQVKAHEYNIHSEEKKVKCPLCNFICKMKSSLTLHMRTHTKERPYKCREQNCGYRGKTSRAIKEHEKRRHPQIFKEIK